MRRFNIAKLCRATLVAFCIFVGNQESGWAQVFPDDTLGAESSVLGTGRVDGNVVQMIEGGATRGGNLFHSFSEFNIGVGEQVYFANPADIDNILSRVTGNSLSTINGLLGVDGMANLFFLNPNGIMFGPDARLDVAGSFTASTANSFDFADGSRFNTSLLNRPVLSISVPLGIQMNGSVQGNIESTGALEAGQDISILGKRLFLAGSLTTGRNLTLQAQEIANDSSLNLLAEGNVILSDYVGGSLIVETIRSLETGDLNTSDDGGGTEGGAITLRADGNITVAGDIDSYSYADAGQVENGGSISISSLSGDVVINGDVTAASYSYSGNTGNGGAISVTSRSGDVVINGDVTTTSYSYSGDTGDGGTISVSSSLFGNIDIAGDINTYTFSELGSTSNGGNIKLSSDIGNITSGGELNSTSASEEGNVGSGGNITLSSSAGNIMTSGLLNAASASNSGDAENSGNIMLSSNTGNITTRAILEATSTSVSGSAGDAGEITLSTGSFGSISTAETLDTGSTSTDGNAGNGGNIIVSSVSGSISTAETLDTGSTSTDGNAGNGGNITVSSASGNISTAGILDAGSTSSNGSTDNGGNIILSSNTGNITTRAALNATSTSESGSAGDAGEITLSTGSLGSISTAEILDAGATSTDGNAGNGGNITVSSASGNISTAGILDAASTSSNGSTDNGGNIILSSNTGNITTRAALNATSTSESGSAGDAGEITLSTGSLGSISTAEALDTGATSTDGNAGNGGNINIFSVSGNISTAGILDAGSTSSNGSTDNGGNINVSSISGHTEILGIVDSSSYAPYGSAGNAGLVSITSTSGNITTGSNVFSDSFSIADNAGSAGGIFLSTELGNLISNGDLSSSSVSRSGSAQRGGTISLLVPNGFIQGKRGQIVSISIAESGNSAGVGGTVTLESNNISELEVFTLSSSNRSGDVKIQGSENELVIQSLQLTTTGQVEIPAIDAIRGAIIVDTNELGQSGATTISSLGDLFLNNIIIQSDANGSNPAGTVTIRTPGAVTFSNTQINSNANSTGNAGSIQIDSAELSLGSGDRISAATSALGDGGTITINATESVFLGEGVQDSAPIISVEASGAGKPGSIVINTPDFVLSETARITATATATATNSDEGGSIDLNANQMDLAGTVGIFAETQGNSPGGILTLQPYQGNLNNRTRAQPQSPSISSDVVLPSGSSFDLTLAEGSVISASTTGSGNGGDLQLFAPESITISGSGRLAVGTSGSGRAGDVTATARSLTLADRVVLSASTTGEGDAGNINFNISDQLTIDNSTVESRTFPDSTGQGGNINVNNAAQVSLLNGGNFTLNSEGTGEGGDFSLSADTLTLARSQITATTQSSNGGDFIFDLGDYLLLRNGSLISTEAGIAGEDGNGGSITINIPNGFVIALPDENSDIRANAFEGNGGTVNITARNLLGIAFRPDVSDTPSSDITSSSRFGNSGIVTIDELNTETLQPENELPVETAPATVARGCRAQGTQTGSFVSTGRGGLPTSPVEPLSASSVWQDLEPVVGSVDSPDSNGSNLSIHSTTERVAIAPQPITEAQQWHRAADGTVTLLAQATEPAVQLSQALGCGAGDR